MNIVVGNNTAQLSAFPSSIIQRFTSLDWVATKRIPAKLNDAARDEKLNSPVAFKILEK